MNNHSKKNKWKFLIVFIWILCIAAAGIACISSQRSNVYEKTKTEMVNQAEIISSQFDNVVDTNFNTRAILHDRLISGVKTISFVLEKYDDIDQANGFLEDIVNTTELQNLWIFDRNGNVLFESGDAPEDKMDSDYITFMLDSRAYELLESYFDEDDQYYSTTYLLENDSNNIVWGAKDQWLIYAEDTLSDTLTKVVDSFSWDTVIQDIAITRNGAVLAVSEIDGSVLSFSDPSFKEQPVEDLNIKIPGINEAADVDQLQEKFSLTGEVTEIEVDSIHYYATKIDIDKDLFLMLVPTESVEKEIINNAVIILLPLIIITGIGVLFLFFIAGKNPKRSKNGISKKDILKASIGKLKVFTILAVILMLIFSLYLETSLMYARMFEYTSTTAESVMLKKSEYDKTLKELQTWLQNGTLEKNMIARCSVQNAPAGKLDRQYISDLSDCLNVTYLYVFDRQGKVSLTNAPYDGFIIDDNSPFHALLEGTESVAIKQDQKETSGEVQQNQEQASTDVQPNQEQTSSEVKQNQAQTSTNIQQDNPGIPGEVMQISGVTMIDESNRVEGALLIADSTFSMISDSTSYDVVFQSVFLKNNTIVIAVNSKNMFVLFFAQVDGSLFVSNLLSYDYTEATVAALGIDETLIKDKFNGEMFAVDNQYFASVRRSDNAFMMVLHPLVFIDTFSLLSIVFAAIFTLLFFILLIYVAGRINKASEEDLAEADSQTTENKELENSDSNINNDKAGNNVFTLLGGLVDNKKYGFDERWPSDGKKWKDKTQMEKFSTTVKLICVIVLVLIAAYVVIAGKNSIFYYCFYGEWSNSVNLYSITVCIVIIIMLFILYEIIHKILYLIARAAQSKGETICSLINSFMGYILFITGVFIVLGNLGVNLTTLSLTAGVAGVIFGIGCQNIVADMLAGIIMAFEGVAQVGDFISYNGKYATIQSIGVRTTKLKWFSEVTIVRNNEFKNYINMPGDQTNRVVVKLYIDLKESITRVESVIEKELDQIQDNIRAELGEDDLEVNYRGVNDIKENGIALSFAIYCKGWHYGKSKRLLNRSLLLMCERNGIILAMPQVVINEREDANKNSCD